MRTRLAAACSVCAILAAAPGASAVLPAKESLWVGKTSQGFPIRLHVLSDRRGVTIRFNVLSKCSNGRTFGAFTRFIRRRPRVGNDGAFSYIEHDRDISPLPGMPYRFDQDQRITGVFRGRVVRGSYSDATRFQGGPTCRVEHLTFTATRR